MKAPAITVWIHGTKPIQLLPKPLSTLHIERLHKFMTCEPGLHKADYLDPSFHHHHIARSVHRADPQTYPWETFYLFGWSGILKHQERQKAAAKLHKSLNAVIREYEGIYKHKPTVRLITHSHGGNVALNLATINEPLSHNIGIHELIALACPVQKITSPLAKHPLFHTVYSIHSHADLVQIADPQGWPTIKQYLTELLATRSLETIKNILANIDREPFFSERHFSPHAKIIQAHLKINMHNLAHIQFMLNPFISALPKIMDQLRLCTNPKIISQQDIHLNIDLISDSIEFQPIYKK